MAAYYDVVLGLIPLMLAAGAGAGLLAGVSLTTAIPAGAFVALLLIVHALFVNGPTAEPVAPSTRLVDAD